MSMLSTDASAECRRSVAFHCNQHFMSLRCCLLLIVGSRLGLWLYLTSLLVAALSALVLLRVFLQHQGEGIAELRKLY